VVNTVKKEMEGEAPRLVREVELHVEEESMEGVFKDLLDKAPQGHSISSIVLLLSACSRSPSR
jgi:hypothetical protein